MTEAPRTANPRTEDPQAESPRFERIDFTSGWPVLRERWSLLHDGAQSACPFYHPVFLEAAHRAGPGWAPTEIVTGWRGEELVFAVPLLTDRLAGGLARAELWALRGFDHLGPLDASSDRGATESFLDWAGEAFDVLSARGLDAAELERFSGPGTFARPAFRCPYLDLPADAESLLAGYGANLRSSLRRRTRAAESAGLRYRVLGGEDSAATLEAALEVLWRLHRARSEQLERASAFLRSETLELHRVLVRASAGTADGPVRFVEGHLGDRVVATLYGFKLRRSFLFFQSGFDPDLVELSPGVLVMHRSMVRAIEEGCTRFDFLRGADAYKARWTDRSTVDHLLHRPLTARGRLGVGALRLRRAAWRRGRLRGLIDVLRNRN